MKAATLIFVLAIAAFVSSAQYNSTVNAAFNTSDGDLQLMPDSTIRVTGIASHNWWFGRATIFTSRYDFHGRHLSTAVHQQLSHEVGWFLKTIPLSGGRTFAAASLVGCDYGFPATITLISESDAVSWGYVSKSAGENNQTFLFQPVSPDVYYLQDYYGHSFYKEDGTILTVPPPYYVYDQITKTGNGYVATLGPTLSRLDSTFSPIKTLTVTEPIIDAIQVETDFLFATLDSLYYCDQDLNIEIRQRNPSTGKGRLFKTRYALWVFDENTNHFYRLEDHLHAIDTFQLHEAIEVRDILTVGDSVVISGNTWLHNGSVALLYTTGEDFGFGFPTDIGITRIRLKEDVIAWNHDWGWPGSWPVTDVNYGPVYVTISNFGTTHVDETKIRFHEYACPSFCEGELQFEWTLQDLDLAPGESREVYLDDLAINCAAYNISELCLYTMNPDQELDLHADNDRFCLSVDVLLHTAEMNQSLSVSVFPNPVSDRMFIQSENAQIHAVTLMDIHGKQVLRANNSGSGGIDISGIPAGVYFVQIYPDNQAPVTTKVVIQ